MSEGIKGKLCKAYGSLCCCSSSLQNPLLFLIRVYWGYLFFLAGKGKFENFERTVGFFTKLEIPMPEVNVTMAAGTEMIGGALLVIGLFSRLVSIPLVFTMIVAYITADFGTISAIFAPDADWATLANFKPFVQASPFNFLLASLIILAFGPGKWSLDGLCCKGKKCELPQSK
ncbi:MAG: DoxX family protein [Bdellovibrionota bacterium]